MARPIKPTPVLVGKSAKLFLEKTESNKEIKTRSVPTPKLNETLKRFAVDAVQPCYNRHHGYEW